MPTIIYLGVSLKEKYGFNIDPKIINNTNWFRFSDFVSIGFYGKKHSVTIAWPDDGRQPTDEYLLQISFSTGAYIFGQDYPLAFFNQFFNELKTFNPDYIDSHNHNLYFKLENAGAVFNSFPEILQKYRDLNKEDVKRRHIENLKKQLESLQVSQS